MRSFMRFLHDLVILIIYSFCSYEKKTWSTSGLCGICMILAHCGHVVVSGFCR